MEFRIDLSELDVTESTVVSADGTRLAARVYAVPKRRRKGAVAVIHGHGEHQDRYRHVAKALVDAGFETHTVDLRGHGRSPGYRGHTPDFEFYLDDIEALLGQVPADLPRFLLGHSMGGGLVLNYGLRRAGPVNGIVASGPFLRLSFQPPAWKAQLGNLMAGVWPDFAQPSGLETVGLCRDPEVVRYYEDDPLCHNRITARSFADLSRHGEEAIQHAADFSLPLLLIHGADDSITCPNASREFVEAAGSVDKTGIIWPNLYHEVMNEPEREEVLATITKWLSDRSS